MISCADYAKKMVRSTRTIRRWIAEGRIEAIKQGRYWYILENNERTPERTFASDDTDIERTTSGYERSSDSGEIRRIFSINRHLEQQLEQQQEETRTAELEREQELQKQEEIIRQERREAETRALREQQRERQKQEKQQERQMWEELIRQVQTESIENLTESVKNQRVENQQEEEIGEGIVEAVKPAISKIGGTISEFIKSETIKRKRDRENPAEAMQGMGEMVKSMVDLRNEVFNPLPVQPPVAVENEDLDEDKLDEDNDEGDAGLGLGGLAVIGGLTWLLLRK